MVNFDKIVRSVVRDYVYTGIKIHTRGQRSKLFLTICLGIYLIFRIVFPLFAIHIYFQSRR